MRKKRLANAALIMIAFSGFLFAQEEQSLETVKETAAEEAVAETDNSQTNQETAYNPDRFLMVEEYSDHPSVEYWKKRYLEEKRFSQLKEIAERSKEYRLYARKVIQERQLPPELEYLPIIESSYIPTAKSRTGATGLWQFMENSVANYLILNEYLDERLDPWKSTEAGLKKLEDNYRQYDDWYLALAGYNCGNRKVALARKKSAVDEKDYWSLSERALLPKQTADYVPQLIAVAEICSAPDKFMVEIDSFNEEFKELQDSENEVYGFVEIKKPCLLSDLAKASDMTEKELKRLNPSLLRHFTPPDRNYSIRIPAEKKELMEKAVSEIRPLEFPFRYKVQKGDSLWAISRRYGVTVKQLCDLNDIKENGILRINQIIYIPKVKD